MKVLILACLVALAFAGEQEQLSITSVTVEGIEGSEQKPETFENNKQQQEEGESQAKIQPIVQPQPLPHPYAETIPYSVLPQNVLPLAQPAMVLPVFQPEVIEIPSTKETIFPKHKVIPLLKSPVVPIFQRQIPTLTDLKNAQLPLSMLQALMSQVPQTIVQTPMLPTQSLLSFSQPKVLPFFQKAMTQPQRAMPVQTFLLFQEPLLPGSSTL